MTELEKKINKAETGKVWMFYVGQAGYILKSEKGELLVVDVYFSNSGERIEGHIGFKRLLPQMLDPQNIIYDYIIATHSHFDHLDLDAIPLLLKNETTRLLASVNCENELKKKGISPDKVLYGKPGDKVTFGEYLVELVDCDHGILAPDAFGVVLTVNGKKIYMTGDTCKRLDWVDSINKLGPFDVVIGPINGAYGNMNEEEFAEFAMSINSKLIIPCHYGMFASHGGDPGKFLNCMKKRHQYHKAYLMSVGEGIEIE